MDTNILLKKVSLISVLAIAVLSILFVLPITDNFIEHTKFYSLIFGALLVFGLFVVKTVIEKAVRVSISPVSGSLVVFAIATLAATFFTAEYPVEGLLGMGGVFLATTVIALFGGSIMPKDVTDKFLYTLTISSVALTVLTIMQQVGFGPAQILNKLFGFSLPTSLSFSIAGSPFIALQVVGITLLTVVVHVVATKQLNKFFAITLPILVIGTGLFAWNILPGKETALVLPAFSESWSVMLDTIRAPKSALIGAGTGEYRNAYQVFKPIWTNTTQNWNVAFTQASNMPLSLVTMMGVFGLLAWVSIVLKSVQFHKNTLVSSKAIGVFVLLSFLLNLVLPFNTIMLTLQAVAMACLVANEKHRLPLLQMEALKFKMLNKPESINSSNKPMNLSVYLGSGIGFVIVLAVGYFAVRSVQANMLMSQSTQAIAANDVVTAYELQQKAVQLNPYFDVFRRRYSATSALIAVALSNKADITEAEKQQVSELLQQSVTQARAATTLDPNESQNWANLAQVYSNLIGISEDAVNWTIQSYVSAIEANPTDPLLRLELASVFASQEAYEQALGLYDQAINLKPDLAVSHYRRGELLELVKTPEALREARTSYQRALVLIDATSEDYVVATEKIEALEKYMQDNNISLEPEEVTQEEPGQQQVQTGTQDETATETRLSAPSITEQNLNNTDTLNTNSEPVELNQEESEEPAFVQE